MAEPGMQLADMTWPQAREALAAAQVVMVPIGSTEQHGPGMLLRTDTTIAAVIAARVADRLRPRAVVAPALPYGISAHHMRFPGTMTLQPETFMSVVFEVVRSLQAHGARRVFLLNGHGGNQAALGLVVARARQELGLPVATALYLGAAADLLRERFGRAYAHACEIEASVALAAAPDLVRPEALAAGAELPAPYRHAVMAGGGAGAGAFVDAGLRMDELTANGALGDPARASREAGEAVLRVVED
ncbi:MAG: creatininase family protein, partial [Chloroflexi bacterium]|nr:creatininase family protein [Chloroflexota bacterium]